MKHINFIRFAVVGCMIVGSALHAAPNLSGYYGQVVALEELARDWNMSADQAFKQAVSADMVVVDVYADWCGPCKRLAPELKRMAREWDRVLFIKVNADKHRSVVAQLGVRGLPTILYFKSGAMITKTVGDNKKEVRRTLSRQFG